MTTILRIGLLILLLCASSAVINGASDPKPEESESTKKNKFREREASDDMLGYPNVDEDSLLDTKCPRHIELRWQTEVSSSIYATPLIADINSDGKLEVVVPSFVHYLEVLEGSDGDKLPGWPAFHQSTIHSSPLLYDIDKDANKEIVLATYNGVINFFRASGYMLAEKLEVPRRKVRKNWYVGLHPDPVDRSHPDVHDESLVEEASHINSVSHMNESTSGLNTSASTSEIKDSSINTSKSVEEVKNGSGQADGLQNNINNATKHDATLESITGESTTGSQRRLLEDTDSKEAQVGTSESHANVDTETHAATVENKEELEEDADASFDIFRDAEDLADEYNYDYDDYVDESMWGDEEWTEAEHEKLEDYVNIDAHIMCTPVIADIDRDGIQEMIIAVSYFFDCEDLSPESALLLR